MSIHVEPIGKELNAFMVNISQSAPEGGMLAGFVLSVLTTAIKI